MDPVVILRVGYISTAVSVVLLYYIAPLRTRFLSYGVRDALDASKQKSEKTQSMPRKTTDDWVSKLFAPLTPLLDQVQSLRVPHSWFKHFYAVAIPISLFWLHQIVTRGSAFGWLASRTLSGMSESRDQSSDVVRAYMLWTMFFGHLCRRLYESFTFDKKSASTMWIGHWIMGLLHYLAVTIALWVEAAPALSINSITSSTSSRLLLLVMQLVVVVPVFILLNISQHRIHKYLYHLPSSPRVHIPSQGIFKTAISPHYGSEVGLYACLFFLSSSSLLVPNWTMLSVLCFVMCNLSVSAQVAKDKYAARHDAAGIQQKSLLGLPGLCRSDLQPLL